MRAFNESEKAVLADSYDMLITAKEILAKKLGEQVEKNAVGFQIDGGFIRSSEDTYRVLDWVRDIESVAGDIEEVQTGVPQEVERFWDFKNRMLKMSPHIVALRAYREAGCDYRRAVVLLERQRDEYLFNGTPSAISKVYEEALVCLVSVLGEDNRQTKEYVEGGQDVIEKEEAAVRCRYYKLTDDLNFGEIVREEDGRYYIFNFGLEKWVETMVLFRYITEGDGMFGRYEEVSLKVATETLTKARIKINNQLEIARRLARSIHACQTEEDGELTFLRLERVANLLTNIECKIVTYLQSICKDKEYTPQDLESLGFSKRIINSVGILFAEEDSLLIIKQDGNAWNVRCAGLVTDIGRLSAGEKGEHSDRVAGLKRELCLLAS